MTITTAEIIAIGDELISGQRLDTNSQWLSRRLSDLGLEPSFHSSFGDDFDDGVNVFRVAVKRADVVVCTGGIGPTKDDLTRQIVAEVAGVDLQLRPEVLDHIHAIFAKYGREMPENNRIQAHFPVGSEIIPNSEGTAPGIDVVAGSARIFALPGVPYEMKEMWDNYVEPRIVDAATTFKTIKHHVVHCFGSGESQVETLLDGMTDRDSVPRVGITASQATISLRIAALGADDQDCRQQIEPAVEKIRQRLGDLVFGENGRELEDVVAEMLNQNGWTISVLDFGFGGAAALAIFQADQERTVLKSAAIKNDGDWIADAGVGSIEDIAAALKQDSGSDFALVISPRRAATDQEQGSRDEFDIAIHDGRAVHVVTQKVAGHSGLVHSRTTKKILNELRLYLMQAVE